MEPNRRNYSKKREAILDVMRSTKEHPSAEWVYTKLKPLFPDLSLGTVYRNLALFRRNGDVVCIGTVAGQERFDCDIHPHPHFICTNCHRVIDLDLAFAASDHYPDIERAIGCRVSGECVSFTGLCEHCLNTRVRPDDSNT